MYIIYTDTHRWSYNLWNVFIISILKCTGFPTTRQCIGLKGAIEPMPHLLNHFILDTPLFFSENIDLIIYVQMKCFNLLEYQFFMTFFLLLLCADMESLRLPFVVVPFIIFHRFVCFLNLFKKLKRETACIKEIVAFKDIESQVKERRAKAEEEFQIFIYKKKTNGRNWFLSFVNSQVARQWIFWTSVEQKQI